MKRRVSQLYYPYEHNKEQPNKRTTFTTHKGQQMNKRFMQASISFTFLLFISINHMAAKTVQEWYYALDQVAKNVLTYVKDYDNKLHYVHPFSKLQDKVKILTDADVEAAERGEAPKQEEPQDPLAEEDRTPEEITLLKEINVFIEGDEFNTFIADDAQREALMREITTPYDYDFATHVERANIRSYTLTDNDFLNFIKIYLITRKYPHPNYYFQDYKPATADRLNKMTLVKNDQSVGERILTLLNLSHIQKLIGTPHSTKQLQATKPPASYGLRDFVILAAQRLQAADPAKRTLNDEEKNRLKELVEEFKQMFSYIDSRLFSRVLSVLSGTPDPQELHKLLQQEALAICVRDYYLGGSFNKKQGFLTLIKYFTKEVTKRQRGKQPTEVYLQALVEYELVSNLFPSAVLTMPTIEDESRLKFTQQYTKDLANDKKNNIPLKLQVSRLMNIQSLSKRIKEELGARPYLTVAGITSAVAMTALMAYARKQGRATKLGTFGWLYYKIKSQTTGLSAQDLQFYARKVAPEKIFDVFTEAEALKIAQVQEALLENQQNMKKYIPKKQASSPTNANR